MTDAERPLAMQRLRDQAVGCVSCFLGTTTRKQVVWGRGKIPADVFLVGEAPGDKENTTGEPFVGPAGGMLDRVLGSVGLVARDFYISNIDKCQPPNNRRPLGDEIFACTRRWLLPQIRIVAPRILVALGATPASFFYGQSLKQARGTWTTWNGIRVFAMYHPAALLHKPTYDPDDPKPRTWIDIQALRDAIHALGPRPTDHDVELAPVPRTCYPG